MTDALGFPAPNSQHERNNRKRALMIEWLRVGHVAVAFDGGAPGVKCPLGLKIEPMACVRLFSAIVFEADQISFTIDNQPIVITYDAIHRLESLELNELMLYKQDQERAMARHRLHTHPMRRTVN